MRGNIQSNIDFIDSTSLLGPSLRILEIGSGNGYLVRHLLDQGYNIVGTELNETYIKHASNELGIELRQMAGDALDFPDDSFDIVLSFDVFEHIPETDKHLREVHRILSDGGYYLFGTPNKITNIPFEVIKEKSLTKYKEYHCSLHTYGGLRRRLAKNGFDTTFIKVSIVNEYFTSKVRKYLGRVGLILVRIINPDKLPNCLRTNFYVVAKKLSVKTS